MKVVTASLDTIFTADEAAARMRITKRALIKLGRDIGACSRLGRDYLFSEQDVLDIWQAMRSPPKFYGRAVHVPARYSDANMAKRVQELLRPKKVTREKIPSKKHGKLPPDTVVRS